MCKISKFAHESRRKIFLYKSNGIDLVDEFIQSTHLFTQNHNQPLERMLAIYSTKYGTWHAISRINVTKNDI